MKFNLMLSTTFLLLMNLKAFAHGEDKAGPHNGFIRMPGAFHTEVVPSSPKEVSVYLLDINWKNPTAQNSSVEISFPAQKKEFISCTENLEKTAFKCTVPDGVDLSKKGKLVVKAKREGQVGNDAIYDLPLKLQSGHASH